MDKHEVDKLRGDEAARILGSAVFNEAFKTVREKLFDAWEMLPTSDIENAIDIHRRLKCLSDVKGALERAIRDGKMADTAIVRLDRERTMKEKIFNRLAPTDRKR